MLYRGHSIFRNQPSFTHFNKLLEDPTDALYLLLNEIDPKSAEYDESTLVDSSEANIDPRTKELVKCPVYNYSIKQHIEIFKTKHPSGLKKSDHLTLLHVLRATQQEDIDQEILLKASHLNDVYTKEKAMFQRFVQDYEQRFKERIYAPASRFTLLYRKWYKNEKERLLQCLPEEKYNTLVALPHVIKATTWEKDKEAEIKQCKLLARRGWVRLWKHASCQYQKVLYKLEDYCLLKHNVNKLQLEQELTHKMQLESTERNCCYFAMESLLFIMTAGLYVDLPTEMSLSIEQNADSGHKILRFGKPLPARHCGLHTHQLVAEMALHNFNCAYRICKWLKVQNEHVTSHIWEGYAEINACQHFAKEYKLHTHDEYLQKHSGYHEKNDKTSEALLQFAIQSDMSIILSMQLPPALNEQATEFLGNHSIKLEHKAAFGSEVMSLQQLLQTWWQLKLLNLCNLADHAICTRIAIKNFDIMYEERLQLNQLEKKLEQMYKVKTSHLLAKLDMFLEMLQNMPTGTYLLRYNPKFSDKLVLSAPSTELNQNTISLHSLLAAEPNDFIFMLGEEYLAIADDICNRMHTHHKIMPCAFRPLAGNTKPQNKRKKLLNFEDIDDRTDLLQKVKQREIKKQKITKQLKRKRYNENRKKRNEKTQAENASEQAERDEFQKEIELYELLQ